MDVITKPQTTDLNWPADNKHRQRAKIQKRCFAPHHPAAATRFNVT